MLNRLAPLLIVWLATVVACGGSAPEPEPASAGRTSALDVSLDKNDYPVLPNPDAGADPDVSADDGGRGFTGEGWETSTDYDLIGDPRAVKGGTLREYVLAFPGTLRMHGPESNTLLNFTIQGMVYESLLSLHPNTLEYMPVLATHWQTSEDRLTYRFRLDPNARWSDGEPVVAEDIVATWNFLMDQGLQDPMNRITWSKFEEPVAETKYIVRVTSNTLNWRNFLYIADSMPIMPAHVLEHVDGEAYLRDYNFSLIPGTGPYVVPEEEVDKGTSLTMRRRTDYWAESYRRNIGVNNFDEIREIVVRDQNLAFEMFKKGDLDRYFINVSRVWVEDMDFDRVRQGAIQKRKVYNSSPNGVSGLAFNMRIAPFDDVRVREALALLLNREQLIEKLFYDEYQPQNSYYAGSLYENPDNPKNEYDPERALTLLAEAGWDSRDSQGRLIKDGQPLAIEVLYGNQGQESWMTVYQEDLRKVGIALNLRLVTPETLFQLVMERKFDMVSMAWTGLVFPNPETAYHSSLADQDNNNNITGVKSARIDEIADQYDQMFDLDERVAGIREIDGILANQYPYLLEWMGPFQRIGYWNKFGYPEGILTRFGDHTDVTSLWWLDPEREARLGDAMRDSSVQLEVGETDDRFWLDYAADQADRPVMPGATQ